MIEGRCPHCGGRPIAWPRPKIIEACQKWIEQHGKPPTAKQWVASTPDHPANSMVCREFGSWNAMLAEAGVKKREFRTSSPWGREDIIRAIFEFKFRHGRLPRFRDWAKTSPDHPPSWRVQRVFGSFSGAIVAAGYEPVYTRRSKRQLRAVAANVTKREGVTA